MSEVREITKAEKPPLHSNHVLVERTRQGTVVVSGTSVREDDTAHVSLPHFGEMQEALDAACQWADAHGSLTVFVVDRAKP